MPNATAEPLKCYNVMLDAADRPENFRVLATSVEDARRKAKSLHEKVGAQLSFGFICGHPYVPANPCALGCAVCNN